MIILVLSLFPSLSHGQTSQCSGPQLNRTLSLDSSLMGPDSSDNLTENSDKIVDDAYK